jgi:hypothetical protein
MLRYRHDFLYKSWITFFSHIKFKSDETIFNVFTSGSNVYGLYFV